jgi:hypothetical protein
VGPVDVTAIFILLTSYVGFRVQGSRFRVQGSRFKVQGSGFRVQGSRFRVQGSSLRVFTIIIDTIGWLPTSSRSHAPAWECIPHIGLQFTVYGSQLKCLKLWSRSAPFIFPK